SVVTAELRGTNGFRLMPADELAPGPATGAVTTAAGGNVTTFAYTWQHPDDGPQDGVVVAWADGAVWLDSWHQQPGPMSLVRDDGGALVGTYAEEWRWIIRLDTSSGDAVTMSMENVVPASAAAEGAPAGPYVAMDMRLEAS
ncbi:MAG TPA: hypothetical protein VEA78_10760, partial [Acidimicrobiales bacterium]|nr:hypothetical protein [Acidimicrobiales bacterium]